MNKAIAQTFETVLLGLPPTQLAELVRAVPDDDLAMLVSRSPSWTNAPWGSSSDARPARLW